jgi:hypothetical protein
LLLVLPAAVLGALAVQAPAAADVVQPAGRCVGIATWNTAGFTKSTADLSTGEVVEVPRTDVVRWSGKVVGPAAGTPRAIDGEIALKLPPLLGSIPLGDWNGQATEVERSDVYTYDVPGFVPAGVVFEVRARHSEAGAEHCTAAVRAKIAGGPFDSPLIFVALAGLLLTAGGLVLLGWRPSSGSGNPGAGRAVSGGLVGLFTGLFAGLTLVLFGAIPLASPVVTVLLLLGPVAGAVWAKWSPLGARRSDAGRGVAVR